MTMAHERSDAEVPAVEVRDLSKVFPINNGLFRRADQLFAVDKVSFQVAPGETLGLVGESGCGKSTTANLMVGLLRPSSGSVLVKGRPVTKANGKTDKWISSQLQMVFQDPFGSLNPRLTAAQNVMEPLRIRNIGKKSERRDRAAQLFQQVGLGTEYLDRYPAAFSGGQRQRISIARALATSPSVILLDEPVSALDVSVQAQVLNLLQRLQRELGVTYIFVSHDLAVVRQLSDRVAVMYLGRIVEIGVKAEIFQNPMHPYTQALLSSIPIPDPLAARARERIILKGELPSPVNPPTGCHFRTRCPRVQEICALEVPALRQIHSGSSRLTACHFPLSEVI